MRLREVAPVAGAAVEGQMSHRDSRRTAAPTGRSGQPVPGRLGQEGRRRVVLPEIGEHPGDPGVAEQQPGWRLPPVPQRVVTQPRDHRGVHLTSGQAQGVQNTGRPVGDTPGVGEVPVRGCRVHPPRVSRVRHAVEGLGRAVAQPAQRLDRCPADRVGRGQLPARRVGSEPDDATPQLLRQRGQVGQVGAEVIERLRAALRDLVVREDQQLGDRGQAVGVDVARIGPGAPGRDAGLGWLVAGGAEHAQRVIHALGRLEVDQPHRVVVVDQHVGRADVDEGVAELVQCSELSAEPLQDRQASAVVVREHLGALADVDDRCGGDHPLDEGSPGGPARSPGTRAPIR